MKEFRHPIVVLGAFALLLSGAFVAQGQSIYTPYAFTNFAGQYGNPGSADGPGTSAEFNTPHSAAVDKAGNVYIGDTFNHTVRRITPDGTVTTIAGSPGNKGFADGIGYAEAPRFNSPIGICVDNAGNLFVGDSGNQTIRKISPTGVVSTFAGQVGVIGSANGAKETASFHEPDGMAADSKGNLYVADLVNRVIRQIAPDGTVSTLAGSPGLQGTNDGAGSAARFTSPISIAVDSADNLYIADQGGNTIRKISGGVVSTLAGLGKQSGSTDGNGNSARFSGPQGLATDTAGNVYVCDTGNQTVRKITPDGTVRTVAGSAGLKGTADGTNSAALFNTPRGITVDRSNTVYVADSVNSTIRKLVAQGTNWIVTTLAGGAGQNGSVDAAGTGARFHFIYGLAVDSNGTLFAVDRSNNDIRKITPDGVVSTFAGVPGENGSSDGTGASAQFYGPEGLTVDDQGNIYLVEFFNNTVRQIAPSATGWTVTTLAGCASCAAGTNDGKGPSARFNGAFGLTRDNFGNLYVADTGNRTIRKLSQNGTNWTVSTFAGAAGQGNAVDGTGAQAQFGRPVGLAADSAGNVFVADGSSVRKITPTAVVTTLAGCPPPGCTDSIGSTDGPGSTARFYAPRALAVDSAGALYVADSANALVRKLTSSGAEWMVTTLGGVAGQPGGVDGIGNEARFNQPSGIAVDELGDVYVVNSGGGTIVKGTPGEPVGSPPEFDTSPGALAVSNGFFQFHLRGSGTGAVVVESSTNLSDWVPLQTNNLPLILKLPLTTGPDWFFRARSAP